MPKLPPPLIESGTLSAVGSGQIENYLAALEHTILACTRTSDNTPAWEIYDDLTNAGTYDKVFHSSGTYGDTRIYIRINRNSTTHVQLRSYTDWSNANNKGSNIVSNSKFMSISDTSLVGFYNVVNPDAFTSVINSGTVWGYLYGGELIRDGLTTQKNVGRAYLSQPILTTGSNITFNIDRDLTDYMMSGSQGWIINTTPSGSNLLGQPISIARVTNVGINTITMAYVANTHSVGSVFGVYPISSFVDAHSTTPVGGLTSGLNQVGTGSAITLFGDDRGPDEDTETGNDPNLYGRFMGSYVNQTSLTKLGTAHHWIFIADDGNWSGQDRIRINNDNSRIYRPFPSLTAISYVGCLPDTGSII